MKIKISNEFRSNPPSPPFLKGGVWGVIITVILIFLSFTAYAGESGVAPNVISLPKGPGSVAGLGETFEPLANTGVASYEVNIEVPEGSGGFKPRLKIAYNGGGGNSPIGFGWDVPFPRVERQTAKGLPRYDSTDTFIYQDQGINGELVPLADQSFRLKTEGAFIRATKDGSGWQVQMKSGLVYHLGSTAASQVKDQSGKIFAWNVTEMKDPNGNAIVYEWKGNGNQSYLTKIRYNDYGSDVVCEISFIYEDRSDALTDYRATFPITTALRLNTIEAHRGGRLIRAYHLVYDPESTPSRLAQITLFGSDGVSAMPSLSFEYTKFSPANQSVVQMKSPPGQGLTDPKNALVDINGDSLPDLLVTESGNFRYYLNEDGVSWSDASSMAKSPAYDLSQDGVRLADIDGDGIDDLVVARGDNGNSFFKGSTDVTWSASVPFDQNPVGFQLEDPNTKFIDLNGDRLIDVLRTDLNGVAGWIHKGGGTFERMGSLPPIDETETILLSDPQIYFADMNGDGLLDVVRLRSEGLIYWPSMGYGYFDKPIRITNAPAVDDTSRLRLSDLNGDGLADVVYLGVSHVAYWLNLGNGSLSERYIINGTPSADPLSTSVQFADMDGNGTTDIVWVDVKNGPALSWRYLDVVGNQFAGLITKINNGLGKVVSIDYESSTDQMIRARNDGHAWASALPFPTVVTKRVTVDDSLGGKIITEYLYRDGYYDGEEREFRGFEKAIKTESGDESIATLLTISIFDVGRQNEALKGKLLSEASSNESGAIYRRLENRWEAKKLADGIDGENVVFPALTTELRFLTEGTNDPRYARHDFFYDQYGNIIDELNHGEIASAGDDGSVPFGNDEVFVHRDYAVSETDWILDRVSRESVRDPQGTILADTLFYYDGAVFQGLPLGELSRGNLMRTEKWVKIEDRYIRVIRYRRDAWGNVTAILDAEDGRREIFYDSESHTYPVRERIFTGSDAFDFTAAYDDVFGKIESSTDPNGIATLYRYDLFGRLIAIIRPGDSESLSTTAYSYQLSSPLSLITIHTRVTSGKNETQENYQFIDGLGRLRAEAVKDEGGIFAVMKAFHYNARGKEGFAADPFRCASLESDCPLYGSGLISKPGTSKFYDALARVTKTVNQDGTFNVFQYLPMEERIFDENDTDTNSSHYNTPATKKYDGQGRLISTSFQNGSQQLTTQYRYDALGNLISIADPVGNIRTQTYDGLGRMVAVDDPNAGRRLYIYNDAGNLVEKRKPDGNSVRYKYEPATGRLLAKNIVTSPEDDTWEVIYHYDAASNDWDGDGEYLKGRLAWIEDEAGKEYYGYDARGRLIAKRRAIASQSFDFHFAYDDIDRQIGITYPDGSDTSSTFNERGLLKSVGTYLTNRTYNAAGEVMSETLGDGIVRRYSYDARHRLSDLSAINSSGEIIQQFHYNFDPANNILGIGDLRTVSAEKNQTQSLSYDDINRLVKSDLAAGGISWAYDAIGNITKKDNTLGDARLHAEFIRYGENGAGPYAMTSADERVFQYDLNGNLVHMPGQTLEFDAENRLTRVTKDDGSKTEMIYGHDGERKIKRVTKPDGSVGEVLYIDPNFEVRDGKRYKYIWADKQRIARVALE